MTAELLRVMYAPLDYIHPDHFPTPRTALKPAVSAAINHHLIRRFDLRTDIDSGLCDTGFNERLVNEWALIREAVWLIGCKLARAALARHGEFTKLSGPARQFVAVPLLCPALELIGPITRTNLEIHGGRYLLGLHQQLPPALVQRLVLLLPAGADHNPWHGGVNRSLLTFAFDYAKTTIH